MPTYHVYFCEDCKIKYFWEYKRYQEIILTGDVMCFHSFQARQLKIKNQSK